MKPPVDENKHAVFYGPKKIEFCLLFCDRKTLEIAVHPDRSVVVKAPLGANFSAIEKKVRKKSGWIIRQQTFFTQFCPRTPDRCYVNGETHLYLGRQYRLRLGKGTKNSVKLSRGFFHITFRGEPTPVSARKLLNTWYAKKAQHQFSESMDRCWQKFTDLDMEQPKLAIRRMKKRWGSLSQKGRLTLNTDLIKAPKECIDYVITHELCHLKYHDHSPHFYQLLNAVSPGWQKIKHKLECTVV